MKTTTLPMECVRDDKGHKRLVFLSQNRYQAFLATVKEGAALQVEFSQKRDVKHNKKLHGVLSEVAEALGWEIDAFKDAIVSKLRPMEDDPVTGLSRRQSTAKMTDEEIDALVMEIKAWVWHVMPGFTFAFDEQFQGVQKSA